MSGANNSFRLMSDYLVTMHDFDRGVTFSIGSVQSLPSIPSSCCRISSVYPMPLLWNAIRASVITLNTFPTAGCIKVNTLLNKPVRIVKPFLISSSNRSVQYLCRPTAISSTRSITEGSQERRIMSTLFRRICNFGKRVATLKTAQIKIKEITIFDSPISSVSSSSGRAR